jgi:hypothetical protein
MTVYPQTRTDDQIRRDVELELKWDPIITSSEHRRSSERRGGDPLRVCFQLLGEK